MLRNNNSTCILRENKKLNLPTISKVQNFTYDIIDRAGVVLYNINENNQLNFYFGVHTKTQEYTDFGGGVKFKENPIKAALRELKQETLGTINYKIQEINESLILSYADMIIIFIKTDLSYEEIKLNFSNKLLETSKSELSDIIEIAENDLNDLVLNDDRLYIKVKNYLKIFNLNFIIKSLHKL